MIRETTNPMYKQKPQFSGVRRFYDRPASQVYDGDFVSAGSRSMARGELQTEDFRDRAPKEAKSSEPEPRDGLKGSSMWIAHEASDAPLWLIRDRFTNHIFARVRGSLPWIVDQMKLLADQLGGQVNDLYYQRAP
jgi:hypothetical protein